MVFNGNSFLELSEDTAYYGDNNYTVYIVGGGQFTATWANHSKTLIYTSGTKPTNGQTLWGVSIDSGTTVTNVSGNIITISKFTIALDHGVSGSSDFTIEFYIQPKATSNTTQTVFYIGEPSIVDTYKMIGNLKKVVSNKSYSFSVQISTFTPVVFGELLVGKWYHITIMRYGTVVYLYLNGTRMGQISVGTYIPDANNPNPVPSDPAGGDVTYLSGISSSTTLGGAYNSGTGNPLANPLYGYLTNFRWIKGNAAYLDYRDFKVTVPSTFDTPQPPVFIYTRNDVYTSANPYVAVGLLATSTSDLYPNTILNTAIPISAPLEQVSITDGYEISPTDYDPVTWIIA
jgi:hypothetical protein